MNWRKREEHQEEFKNGETLLVAVSVRNHSGRPERGCHWELSTIIIECDEEWFDILNIDGDWWAWDWSDVEYWCPIKEVQEGLPSP